LLAVNRCEPHRRVRRPRSDRRCRPFPAVPGLRRLLRSLTSPMWSSTPSRCRIPRRTGRN